MMDRQRLHEILADRQWHTALTVDQALATFGSFERLWEMERLGLVESRQVPSRSTGASATVTEWRLRSTAE